MVLIFSFEANCKEVGRLYMLPINLQAPIFPQACVIAFTLKGLHKKSISPKFISFSGFGAQLGNFVHARNIGSGSPVVPEVAVMHPTPSFLIKRSLKGSAVDNSSLVRNGIFFISSIKLKSVKGLKPAFLYLRR